MLENNKILEKNSASSWCEVFDSALIPWFFFCYINKIWSSKWKQINCIQQLWFSVFQNFLLLPLSLKGKSENATMLYWWNFICFAFLYRGIHDYKRWRKGNFCMLGFSVSSFAPRESPETAYLCIWQNPETPSFCLQQSKRIMLRFGAWGEKIPEKGWRHMLYYVKYWPLPSNVRFSWISSQPFIVCFHSVPQDALLYCL